MYTWNFRRKEDDPEEKSSGAGGAHPLFGNLNPFDILQHLVKKSKFLNVHSLPEFQTQRPYFQVQQRKRKKCQILCEPMQSQFLSSKQLRSERKRKKRRGDFFRISNRGRNGSIRTIREDFRIRITLSTTV